MAPPQIPTAIQQIWHRLVRMDKARRGIPAAPRYTPKSTLGMAEGYRERLLSRQKAITEGKLVPKGAEPAKVLWQDRDDFARWAAKAGANNRDEKGEPWVFSGHILSPNLERAYGPDTCVFVPRQLTRLKWWAPRESFDDGRHLGVVFEMSPTGTLQYKVKVLDTYVTTSSLATALAFQEAALRVHLRQTHPAQAATWRMLTPEQEERIMDAQDGNPLRLPDGKTLEEMREIALEYVAALKRPSSLDHVKLQEIALATGLTRRKLPRDADGRVVRSLGNRPTDYDPDSPWAYLPTATEIAARREATGMSLKEAGAIVGVSGACWSQWERGVTQMRKADWVAFMTHVGSGAPADARKLVAAYKRDAAAARRVDDAFEAAVAERKRKLASPVAHGTVDETLARSVERQTEAQAGSTPTAVARALTAEDLL